PFQAFKTSDGNVFVAAFHDALWKKLCVALGKPELGDDARFTTAADRTRNRAALLAAIEPAFAKRTSTDWVDTLEAAGVPVGRINTMEEVFQHPQLKHNGMVVEMTHPVAGPIKVLKHPVHMSANPASIRTPPPLLGEHNAEILGQLGYDAAAIER